MDPAEVASALGLVFTRLTDPNIIATLIGGTAASDRSTSTPQAPLGDAFLPQCVGPSPLTPPSISRVLVAHANPGEAVSDRIAPSLSYPKRDSYVTEAPPFSAPSAETKVTLDYDEMGINIAQPSLPTSYNLNMAPSGILVRSSQVSPAIDPQDLSHIGVTALESLPIGVFLAGNNKQLIPDSTGIPIYPSLSVHDAPPPCSRSVYFSLGLHHGVASHGLTSPHEGIHRVSSTTMAESLDLDSCSIGTTMVGNSVPTIQVSLRPF